jgi:hypothetical protein
LKTAAKVGWGPWHGAKNTGIGEFEGISGGKAAADPAAGYGGIGSDAAASERAATAIKGTNTDTSTPDASQTATGAPPSGFIDKLQDPKTGAMQGLGEAITGLGQATASTGLNKGMYDTPAPARTIAARDAVGHSAGRSWRRKVSVSSWPRHAAAQQRKLSWMAIFASTTLGSSDPRGS